MKKALITGITGQDGSFLAEFLLGKGYDVHGTIRRSSVDYRERIAHLEGHPNFHLHYADLGDSMSILQVVKKVKPTEIYNLAAQSHVQVSFDAPEFTADVDATGVLRILEAVRQCDLIDTCRIYQASTSELYGKVEEVPQNEKTPFHPYSPYAVAKLYGYWIVKEYREAYNMFCCSGILFNHESERRALVVERLGFCQQQLRALGVAVGAEQTDERRHAGGNGLGKLEFRRPGFETSLTAAADDVNVLVDETGNEHLARRVDHGQIVAPRLDAVRDLKNLVIGQQNVLFAKRLWRKHLCIFDQNH